MTRCSGSRHLPDTRFLLRDEFTRIAERFEAADHRAKRATTIQDGEAAEWERLEAADNFWAAEADLADLLLLLLRLALHHQPRSSRTPVAGHAAPQSEALERGCR